MPIFTDQSSGWKKFWVPTPLQLQDSPALILEKNLNRDRHSGKLLSVPRVLLLFITHNRKKISRGALSNLVRSRGLGPPAFPSTLTDPTNVFVPIWFSTLRAIRHNIVLIGPRFSLLADGECGEAGSASCEGCGMKIVDRFLMRVGSSSWHEQCVTCSACGVPLSKSCYYRHNGLYCKNDYDR